MMSSFDNHFLFSETYINDYIKNNREESNKLESLNSIFDAIKEWHEPFVDGEYSDEDWIEEFIDLTLDVLGFKKSNEDRIRILYTNSITTEEKPVASCYVLEKDEDLSCNLKGKYYAYKAVKAAKNKDLDWSMLTNGYKWRIYNTKNVSCYENYLEVDIKYCLKNLKEPDEAFKLFHLFFSSKTFYKNADGELEIEGIKDLSDKKAETIENFLRDKVEEILKDLCYGLKENMKFESYEEQDRKNIYNDAVILLFRLLFIGYAESRKLLPWNVKDKEYIKNSFFTICNDAKEVLNSGKASDIKDGFDFWDRIDDNLRIYVDNTYDGGLFENFDKPILCRYKISNGYLIKCLAEMTYYIDKRTGMYKEAIEYKDLSVRNLGSIYEGLLEYNLFIAKERMVIRKSKGKVAYIEASKTTLKKSDEPNIIEAGGIYLSQDALERKDTGSYYTPEDVVDYIVTKTVGKKIEELKEELNDILKEKIELMLIEPSISIKTSIQKEIDNITIEFIENKILKLSIIDSAMGSGHFLVNATYNVATSIVEILCENDWINEDIDTNISYWKRRVVEKCIYGIDINKLAVYLARVSLWLISASNDKALSFIDHHLKEGNSIIGTDKTQVEIKDNDDDKIISLFDVSYIDFMGSILDKYKKLGSIRGNNKEEVEEQKHLYREIEEELKLTKVKYDFYLASQYNGGIQNKDNYSYLMKSKEMKNFETKENIEILAIARQKKFFHWELEFPEIMLNGGFDIVIGNPPYVEADSSDYLNIKVTSKCHNLYTYMMEINIKNMNKSGKVGIILPSASLSTPRMKDFQKLMIENSKNIYLSTYDDRPAKIFLRLESLRIAIIISDIEKEHTNNNVYVTKYMRWYAQERKVLFNSLKYVKLSKWNRIDGYIPKIGSEIEDSIFNKLFCKKADIANCVDKESANNRVYYGYGVRYWIKAMTKSAAEIDNTERSSTGEKNIQFSKVYSNKVFTAMLNSSIFFMFFTSFSDARNLTRNTILSFPFSYHDLSDLQKHNLIQLCDELMESYISNSQLKTCNYTSTGKITYREYYPRKSKEIIDKIDAVLSDYYGFSEQELDYIRNFEVRFRLGKEGEA